MDQTAAASQILAVDTSQLIRWHTACNAVAETSLAQDVCAADAIDLTTTAVTNHRQVQ